MADAVWVSWEIGAGGIDSPGKASNELLRFLSARTGFAGREDYSGTRAFAILGISCASVTGSPPSCFISPKGSTMSRSRVRSRRCTDVTPYRPRQKSLRLEQLEERALLSVASPSEAVTAGCPEVDWECYDPSSLLVRFRDDSSVSALDADPREPSGLAKGTQIGKAFSLVSGLREVRVEPGCRVEDALAAYRANPNVLYAEPNYRVQLGTSRGSPVL